MIYTSVVNRLSSKKPSQGIKLNIVSGQGTFPLTPFLALPNLAEDQLPNRPRTLSTGLRLL
ncbi:MAG: hypothetical protein F6K65_37640 [Moorea sp. SIO3C2]|nr:hypothetical protein [Moorena sp. SIO3C2]